MKKVFHLVDDWKESWHWYSQIAQAAGVALQGSWLALPADMKTAVPQEIVTVVAIFLLLAGMFGRVVVQGEQRT